MVQAPSVNLHGFASGSPEAEKMLLFRDWLRSHPEDRDLYEQTEREPCRTAATHRPRC